MKQQSADIRSQDIRYAMKYQGTTADKSSRGHSADATSSQFRQSRCEQNTASRLGSSWLVAALSVDSFGAMSNFGVASNFKL